MGEGRILNLVLVANSVRSLNPKKANTSSELFSLSLAYNLSKFFDDIYILSEGTNNFSYNEKNRIKLFPLVRTGRYYKNNLTNVIYQLGVLEESQRRNTVFMIFGYNYYYLWKLGHLCRKHSAKLVSFTFDTHKVGTSNLSGLKKILLECFHELGIKSLNKCDGIILFQKGAYKELRLKIPYLISKVGINKEDLSEYQYKRTNKRFRLLYAGSLEQHNCIKNMIEAMSYLTDCDVELIIYGDGTLREYCKIVAESDERIKYLHTADKRTVDIAMRNADVLLNIRDLNSIVCKFAFPSKLIDYMASGVPVLSTDVISEPSFKKAAFVIEDFSPSSIAHMIRYIIDNPEEQLKRSGYAKEYVARSFSWNNISKEIYEFINQIGKGG